MNINKAIDLINNCLMDYCETNISSDKRAQKELEKAWDLITKNYYDKRKAEYAIYQIYHHLLEYYFDTPFINKYIEMIDRDLQKILSKHELKINWDAEPDQSFKTWLIQYK